MFFVEKFWWNKDLNFLLIDICKKLSIKNSFVLNYFDYGVFKVLFDSLLVNIFLNLIFFFVKWVSLNLGKIRWK